MEERGKNLHDHLDGEKAFDKMPPFCDNSNRLLLEHDKRHLCKTHVKPTANKILTVESLEISLLKLGMRPGQDILLYYQCCIGKVPP